MNSNTNSTNDKGLINQIESMTMDEFKNYLENVLRFRFGDTKRVIVDMNDSVIDIRVTF